MGASIRHRRLALGGAVLVAGFIAYRLIAGGGEAAAPQPSALPVSIYVAKTEEVPIYLDFTGTTESIQAIDIRSRVQGYLIARPFEEGALVKKGETLYQIDPRPYQTALDQAKAELLSERANLRYTENEVKRVEPLLSKKFVTQERYDSVRSQRDQARANIQRLQALVRERQLDLEFTRIRAPFTGRISRTHRNVGDLILPGETLLATLVEQDPIYVTFNPGEQDLMRVEHQRAQSPETPMEVTMILADETAYGQTGTLDYIGNALNPQTGTIEMRATFRNPEETIKPGQFVRVRLKLHTEPDAILVPTAAIGDNQGQKYVLVADQENKASVRPIEAGATYDTRTLVDQGLAAGDRVITNNLQKLRDGVPVEPQEAQAGPDASAAPIQQISAK